MSKPLTDEDLNDLKNCGFSIQKGREPKYLGVLAAAEIRKLQALVTELKNAYSAADKKRATAQDDNARLREYVITLEEGVTMINNCGVNLRSSNDRLLKSLEKYGQHQSGCRYINTLNEYNARHNLGLSPYKIEDCDCGLDDALKETDGAKDETT